MRISRVLLSLSALPLSLLVTGCSQNFFANAPGEIHGASIRGTLYGGEQPVVGAKVYLYAAGTSGYNTFSRSMLTTNGGYVTSTGTDGHFSITGDYTCQTGDQVYLVATGGNPGLSDPNATNPALTLMAALGACSSLTPSTGVIINEVTTVAAAYALSGFMTSPTAVASSGTALAKQGVANAFLTASNIVSLAAGQALTTTPAGNGVVPQAEINTLADIIAACVNSDGTASACSNLFASAPNSSGVQPTNVAQALINLAHSPGQNAAAIFSLITAYEPFQPVLGVAPNDWTMAVKYTGAGINGANALAIDGTGNVWISNATTVSELDPTGSPLSPSGGYTGGAIGTYQAAASGNGYSVGNVSISPSGQVWVPVYDYTASEQHIAVLSASGSAVNGSTGYDASATQANSGIFDPSGNYWLAGDSPSAAVSGSNYVYTGYLNKFTSAGTRVSTGSGYTGGGLGFSFVLASDTSGNIWLPGISTFTLATPRTYVDALSEFNSAGTAVSSTGYKTAAFAQEPTGVAVDRNNNVWVGLSHLTSSTAASNVVFEWNNSGALVSPSAGYSVTTSNTSDIAIDGDNRVWWGAYASSSSGTPDALGVMTNAGVSQSPSGGYQSAVLNHLSSIRPDLSGNLWVVSAGVADSTYVNATGSSVDEFIGLASPTVTPLSYAVAHSSLGTRP